MSGADYVFQKVLELDHEMFDLKRRVDTLEREKANASFSCELRERIELLEKADALADLGPSSFDLGPSSLWWMNE